MIRCDPEIFIRVEIVNAAPANLHRCRAWDLAATKCGDWFTCGTKIDVDSSGIYYVEDVKRGQWSADGVRSDQKGVR